MDKKDFINKFKLDKSLDFRNAQVRIDSNEQKYAEENADKVLVDYLKYHIKEDMQEVPLEKGTLKVYKKDDGLYSAMFSDINGQIVQQFHDNTIEMLAKNLQLKSIGSLPIYESEENIPEQYLSQHDEEEAKEDAQIAEMVTEEMLEEHNRMYHKGQEPGEPINNGKGHIKIKFGDFELEIKKSIQDFISDFKKSKNSNKNELIKKALKIVNKRCFKVPEARVGKELLENWDKYKEEIMQTVDALSREYNGKK